MRLSLRKLAERTRTRREKLRISAAFELIDGIPNYNLYVGGQSVRSSRNEAAESRNPATGELFAKVQQAGAAETELAISAAHGAYEAWAATPVSAREAIFFRAADVLAAKTNEIVDVLIRKVRIDRRQSRLRSRLLLQYSEDRGRGDAKIAGGNDAAGGEPGQFGFTVRQPLGVMGEIAPFNAPFLLAMKKVVLALAAGNGFILKPSELTPVTELKIAEVFDEAGLLRLASSASSPGSHQEVGAAIFADPRVQIMRSQARRRPVAISRSKQRRRSSASRSKWAERAR